MFGLIASLLKRRVIDKGLKQGSSVWMIVGAFGVVRRIFRFFGPKTERVRLGERLRPGDELTLRYPGKPVRSVKKEQALVASRRLAAKQAHEAQRFSLAEKAAGAGRKAKKAQRLLDKLIEPRV
jgi:hypothetical protein